MSYSNGIKGLLTEVFSASAGQETLLDCQDVVISQDSKIESRHGINLTTFTDLPNYNATDAKVSFFKIPLTSSANGKIGAYYFLSSSNNIATIFRYDESQPFGTFTPVTSVLPRTLTGKPLGFTYDQSFYLVTRNGWRERQIDDTTNATFIPIKFPPFTDIKIETFQDTQDFSANWLSVDNKVGIRFTYVLNTRYTNDVPREVESAPSAIYEILHPMALRTEVAGSNIASTLKDKSRIRIRIGESFRTIDNPYYQFGSELTQNRRYSLRIYRTKQVPIAEALPTEYFQAFPDIEFGKRNFATSSQTGTGLFANYVTANGAADTFKNGDYIYYSSPQATSPTPGFYYVGNAEGDSFQLFTTALFSSPVTAGVQPGTGFIIKIFEANLTVNDDAIQSLLQLYTNPNQDGEVNRNSLPPVCESVVNYKNYHVAANIQEPLRAYITMVSQPLVKNILGQATIGAGIPTGNYFFTTFAAQGGASALDGITNFDFGIDSPFFRRYPPEICTISGANITPAVASDLPIEITGSSTTGTSQVYFDANLVQQNATIYFRFNGGPPIVALVNPKYNKTSPYTRYSSLPGAYPYSGAVAYDTNLNFLEFGGTLIKPGAPASSAGYNSTIPFYSTGTTPGQTSVFIEQITAYAENVRGQKKPDIISLSGASAFSLPGSDLSISSVKFDLNSFKEPGLLFIRSSSGAYVISYKTVTTVTDTQIKFTNISELNGVTVGGIFQHAYVIDASTMQNAAFYFSREALDRTAKVTWINNVSSQLPLYGSITPLPGYYDKPIGICNSVINDSGEIPAPTFLPNLAKSPGQLLDECVTELVQSLNDSVVSTSLATLVQFVKTDNVGEFYVEYKGDGTNPGKIEAFTQGAYHKYEPALLTDTYTTIAEYEKNAVNAVAISRYNAPESFPDSSLLSPFLVGSDKAKIVALAKNANDCFILKEDGVWRLSISGNSSVGLVDEITQLDTTTYCQAPYSVQEINEEIIFLSQKGFISISGNSISAIGRNIETEVKTKLQRAISSGFANEIRSWVNEEKRIYGCTIPDTTSTYTTYIFNTYTREWTKFALPVLDASTDSQGRTSYLVKQYTVTLGPSDITNLLQVSLNSATVSAGNNFALAEEVHTNGLNRNELDQYDCYYKPQSASIVASSLRLVDQTNIAPWGKMGGVTTDISGTALANFVGKKAYYRKAGVFYPVTFVSRLATSVDITFDSGTFPANITTVSAGDGLYAGVPASATFNPSSVGTPDTNKQFSEYMIHVDEAVTGLKMRFKTDSQANFSATREFAFDSSAPNRTVYRTYIPIAASRGRWFIRQVSHEVPMERLVMTAQTINIRETSSSRVQKNQ